MTTAPGGPPSTRPVPQRVPAEVRRGLARTLWLAGGASLALGGVAVLALELLGQGRAGQGVAVGFGLGFAQAVSWLVPAYFTFDGPDFRFNLVTFGVSPLRIFVVIGGLIVAATLGVAIVPAMGALALTFVAGFVLEVHLTGVFTEALAQARRDLRAGEPPA